MKPCTSCKTLLSDHCFNRDNSRKHGLQNRCKACLAKYREMNREAIKATKAACYAKNRDHYVAKNRERAAKDREGARARGRKYGRHQVADIGPVYAAYLLQIPTTKLTPELLSMKREQILLRRIAVAMKQAARKPTEDPK